MQKISQTLQITFGSEPGTGVWTMWSFWIVSGAMRTDMRLFCSVSMLWQTLRFEVFVGCRMLESLRLPVLVSGVGSRPKRAPQEASDIRNQQDWEASGFLQDRHWFVFQTWHFYESLPFQSFSQGQTQSCLPTLPDTPRSPLRWLSPGCIWFTGSLPMSWFSANVV